MRIGLTFICFNHLSANHVHFLEQAKSKCDYLIVAFHTSDAKTQNEPAPLIDRFIQLKGCKYVDEIIPYSQNTDMEKICQNFSHHIRFIHKGALDWEYVDQIYYKTNQISLHYLSGISSTTTPKIKYMRT